MNRYKYIYSIIFFSMLVVLLSASTCSAQAKNKYSDELIIPPLVDAKTTGGAKVFHLTAQESTHKFSKDISANTFSYGSLSYLCPTIRVKRGDNVEVKVENNLNEDTTFHQHGINLPAHGDGNTMHIIKLGDTWSSKYTVSQQAGTYWYHPHLLYKTGIQVVKGLVGFLIIDDDESANLSIPHEYGVDDIPLAVQDKSFRGKNIEYSERMHATLLGNVGDKVITNGTMSPTFYTSTSLLRFRILNGSSFALHNYYFEDKREFYLIANDAGLLDKPYPVKSLELAPSERREILVDIQDLSSQETIDLIVNIRQAYESVALTITAKKDFKISSYTIPAKLVNYTLIPESEATRTREFFMGSRDGMGMMDTSVLSINNKKFAPDRIDERVELNSTEIWYIKNLAGKNHMMQLLHSFHPHLVNFQVLSYNGSPPPPNLQGWKDTVFLYPEDEVSIIMRFENHTGVYMYHCHQLEHEDNGMMGLFEVVEKL